MEYFCLEDNKICGDGSKRCDHCILDCAYSTRSLIMRNEKIERERALKRLQEQLPEACRRCPFLEILSVDQEKVRCSYYIKDKCILKDKTEKVFF